MNIIIDNNQPHVVVAEGEVVATTDGGPAAEFITDTMTPGISLLLENFGSISASGDSGVYVLGVIGGLWQPTTFLNHGDVTATALNSHVQGVTLRAGYIGNWGTIDISSSSTSLWNTDAYGALSDAGGVCENWGTIHVSATARAVGVAADNVVNFGSVLVESNMEAFGVFDHGSGATVRNTATGVIDVQGGIFYAHGVHLFNGGQVTNDGLILVDGDSLTYGIYLIIRIHFASEGPPIMNNGEIIVSDDNTQFSTSYGIAIGGLGPSGLPDEPTIVNHGRVVADVAIVHLVVSQPVSYNSVWVLNDGELTGDIFLGGSADRIDNVGVIIGDVRLNDGDDIFDTREGTLLGAVDGGNGDDVIWGNDADNVLMSGYGFLLGTDDDELHGGAGDDVLQTSYGNDVFDGGDGRDTLHCAADDDVNLSVGQSINIWGVSQLISIEDVVGNSGTNELIGDAGSNRLAGDFGDDLLTGAGGDDRLEGGGDIDTAIYSIASAAASWVRHLDGSWTVTAGVDGTDSMTGVEFLDFTDRDVFLDRAARTFSGDGGSDILWRNANGVTVIWSMNGETVAGGGATSLQVGAAWSIADTGDFNGDGCDDVLWRNANGQTVIWHMNGGDVWLAGVTSAQVGNAWNMQGVGDFNLDGRDDILWRNANGQTVVWLMNFTTAAGVATNVQVGNAWQIAGIGDFNGDGRDDFVWRHDNGLTAIWHMHEASVVSSGLTSLSAGLNWDIAGVGDFNGDGRDDLLWRSNTGATAIWHMNGTTAQGGLTSIQVGSQWNIAAVGDYNGDGRDDIVWRHDNGVTVFWEMQGASVIDAHTTSVQVGNEWGIV